MRGKLQNKRNVLKKEVVSQEYVLRGIPTRWLIISVFYFLSLFALILGLTLRSGDWFTILGEYATFEKMVIVLGSFSLFVAINLSYNRLAAYNNTKKFLNRVNSLESLLKIVKDKNVDLSTTRDLLEKAKRAMNRSSPDQAKKYLTTALKHTHEILQPWVMDLALETRTKTINEIPNSELENRFLDRVKKLLKRNEYQRAFDLIHSYQQASTALSSAWCVINNGQKIEVDMSESINILNKGISSFRLDNYETAISHAQRSKEFATSLVKKYIINTCISPSIDKIRIGKRLNIDMKKAKTLLRKSKSMVASEDYEKACSSAKEGMVEAIDALEGYVKTEIKGVEEDIATCEKMKIDISTFVELLQKAKQELKHQRFEQAFYLVTEDKKRISKELDVLVSRHLSSARGAITFVKEGDGVFLDLEKMVARAEHERGEGRYEEAIRIVKCVEEEALVREGDLSNALRSLESVDKDIAELYEKNIYRRKAEELLKDAKKSKEEGRYHEAVSKVALVDKQAQMTAELHTHAQDVFLDVEKSLEKLRNSGVDVSQMLTKLKEIALQEDYEKAIEDARFLERDAMVTMDNLIEDVEDNIKSTRSYMLKLREEGIFVDDAEKVLKIADEKFNVGLYNAAIEKASESREKAERTKILYKSTLNVFARIEKVINEARTVGVDVSDLLNRFEMVKLIEDYEKAIELSRSIEEETINERDRLNEKAAEVLKNVHEYISKLDGKGIIVDDAKEALKAAEGKFAQRSLSAAIEKANEARDRAGVVEELYDNLLDALTDTEETINKASIDGVDISDFGNIHSEISEERDYSIAIERLTQLKSDVLARRDKLGRETEMFIEAITKHVKTLSKEGVNVTPVESILKVAEKKLSEGLYTEATEKVNEARERLKEIKKLHKRVKNVFASTEKVIKEVRTVGVDVSDLLNRFEMVKLIEDYEKAIELSRYIEEEAINEKNRLNEKAAEVLKNVHEYISKLDGKGIIVDDAKEALKAAEGKFSHSSYSIAIEKANDAMERSKEIKELHDSALDVFASVEKVMDDAKVAGVDVINFVNTLLEISSLRDYLNVIEKLNLLKEDITQHIEQLRKEAERSVRDAHDYSLKLQKEGVHISNVNDVLKITEEKLSEGLYSVAIKKVGEAKEKMDEIKSLYDSALNAFANAEKAINDAKIAGLDVSGFVDSLLEVSGINNYNEAIQLANIIEEKAKESRGLLGNEAEELLNRARKYIEKLRKEGIYYKDAEELLKIARSKKNVGRYAEAKNYAKSAVEKGIEIKNLHNQTQIIFAEIEKTINGAKDAGFDVTEMSEIFGNIKNIKDYKDAIEMANLLKKEIMSLERKMSEKVEKELRNVKNQLSKLSESGVVVSGVEELVKTAEVSAIEGSYRDTLSLINEARTKIAVVEMMREEADEMIRLPFTHGIETELQVIMKDGKWMLGSQMKKIFVEIIKDTKESLENIMGRDDVPELVKLKFKGVRIKEDRSHNEAVHIVYEVNGTNNEYAVIGKDSHVTFETNILEIQTPPCEYLKELEWWLHTLFRISYESIENKGIGLNLVSTGLNPVEEYVKGVSFGDHHHIGIPDDELRIYAYNLLRDFLPHIVALSVNSPFESGRSPDIALNPNNSIVSRLDSLSIRMEKNSGQLSPVPSLEPGEGLAAFMRKIGRVDEKSARMVDIYPFTRFNTIEVRSIDTQLSISDRIAMAVLIQAVVLKANKMLIAGEAIPCVSSNILKTNREKVFKSGMLAPFSTRDDSLAQYPEFASLYQGKIYDGSGKIMYIRDACINFLYFLRDEISELNVIGTSYLDPICIKIFGGKEGGVPLGPPITSAQYQLYLFEIECNRNLDNLVKELDMISKKTANSATYNPIIEKLGSPKVPSFLAPKRIDMGLNIPSIPVYSGDVGRFELIIANLTKIPVKHVDVSYEILAENKRIVEKKKYRIDILDSHKKKTIQIEFPIEENVSVYKITCKGRAAGETLVKTGSIPVYNIRVVASWIGVGNYITTQEKVDIPYSIEIKNELPQDIDTSMNVLVRDTETNEILQTLTEQITLKAKEKALYVAVTSNLAEWAKDILKIQEFMQLSPISVPTNSSKNMNCNLCVELDLDGKKFEAISKSEFIIYKRRTS